MENLTTGNCVDTLLNANKYSLLKLALRVKHFICAHFESVSFDDIQKIDAINLGELLHNHEIQAAESIIFDRLMHWIIKNGAEQSEINSNLVRLIRLQYIPDTVSFSKILHFVE